MGLLDGIIGNASETNINSIKDEYSRLLGSNEEIEQAYSLVRDVFIFTNKRLILVDKQGITGKKVEYQSIPYKSISRYAIETAGSFDCDAELKIWISSAVEPTITKTFNEKLDVYKIQSIFTDYILK